MTGTFEEKVQRARQRVFNAEVNSLNKSLTCALEEESLPQYQAVLTNWKTTDRLPILLHVISQPDFAYPLALRQLLGKILHDAFHQNADSALLEAAIANFHYLPAIVSRTDSIIDNMSDATSHLNYLVSYQHVNLGEGTYEYARLLHYHQGATQQVLKWYQAAKVLLQPGDEKQEFVALKITSLHESVAPVALESVMILTKSLRQLNLLLPRDDIKPFLNTMVAICA